MLPVSTGVAFRPTSPPERLHDIVDAAESVGVEQVWLWEDCFAEGGLTAAALALSWSENLTIGVGLMPVGLRNPALLAMEIATLARLFPGRFMPGLGHGPTRQMSKVGVVVPSPLTLLREHASAVRELLHGGTVRVDGRYTHLDDVALDWPPSTVPPVLVGARGPRTLRLAGEIADGVVVDSIASTEQLLAARAAFDAGRVAAERVDPSQIVVYIEPPDELSPTDLSDAVRRAIDDMGAGGATAVVFVNHPDTPDPLHLLRALDSIR